ncbi:UNVERIFIED_CONTAM: Bardet-Biedl syndrome 5 protein [Siphonaria sp. JEL0065]|nr:Bardet-Biedl syndrome 5 protein [Siphonaria sp. JEL0065]
MAAIGFNCVQSISISTSESLVQGKRSTLNITAKFQRTRFEFVFIGSDVTKSTVVKDSTSSLDFAVLVSRIHDSFVESKIYRDLRVKGAIIAGSELELLEYEIVYTQIDGVLNVSNDKGIIGRMVISNIRTVWFSTMNDSSNVSIPHLQVANVRVQNSKYGTALCIETYTTPLVTTYRLGFQVPSEPPKKLKEIASLIKDLVGGYLELPIFGIQFEESTETEKGSDRKDESNTRDSQMTLSGIQDDDEELNSDQLPQLLRKHVVDEPEMEFVFDERLGLTVARPKGSLLTSGDVWKL